MILYHGSNLIIKEPDIRFSKGYLDFGKGFYITTYKEQAEKWALRKALRKQGDPTVNVYELDEEKLAKYKLLQFKEDNKEWLDFICHCRKGELNYQQYDIIIGSVADDDVFKTIDMYFKGIWDINRALKELVYYKLNDQICIVNQKALNEVLSFKEAYKVVE